MHYIGIDIAKSEHMLGVIDEAGQNTVAPFKVKNTLKGLEEMLGCLDKAGVTPEDAMIGMEATGHYWLVIYEFLTDQGFEVSVINPIQTNAFRDVLSIRKTKTDAIDCIVIAELLRFGGFEPSSLAEEKMMALKQHTRFRTALVVEMTALKNKATAILDRIFPEYCTLFSEPYGAGSMAILQRFPIPEEVLGTDIRTLTRVLAESSKNRFGRREAECLKELAKTSVGVSLSSKALSFEVKQIVERIAFTEGQIAALEDEIEALLVQTKGKWLATIPGIGVVFASAIAAEVGDASRFENEHKLMAFAGMDPSKIQSGDFDGDKGKMSKRGSPHLRHALFLAADSVRRWDPYFGDYYDKLRAKGKHHYVALSGVARKLCAVVLTLMKEDRAYEASSPKRS